MLKNRFFGTFFNKIIACFMCFSVLICILPMNFTQKCVNAADVIEPIDSAMHVPFGKVAGQFRPRVLTEGKKLEDGAVETAQCEECEEMISVEEQIIKKLKKFKNKISEIWDLSIKIGLALIMLPFFPSISKHIKNPELKRFLSGIEFVTQFAICYKISEWICEKISSAVDEAIEMF